MSYFVSPPNRTTWTMNAAEFAAHLRISWPMSNIQLVERPESNHLLEWVTPIARGELDGSLDRTQQVVHLEGDIYDCAQFAVWGRTQYRKNNRSSFTMKATRRVLQ